jgi:hypothetical protein
VGSCSKPSLTDLLSAGRDVCLSQSLTLPFLMARFRAFSLLHARCKACSVSYRVKFSSPLFDALPLTTGIWPLYPHSTHIFGTAILYNSGVGSSTAPQQGGRDHAPRTKPCQMMANACRRVSFLEASSKSKNPCMELVLFFAFDALWGSVNQVRGSNRKHFIQKRTFNLTRLSHICE